MARRYAPLLCSIWDDDDFQALSPAAQRCYVLLLSQKKLSMVGILSYTPRGWSRGCASTTTADIEEALTELADARFVLLDCETDELLVRTMVKHDPPRGPKSITAMWRAWQAIDSPELRAAVVNEIPDVVWDWEVDGRPVEHPDEALALRNAPSDGGPDGGSDGARAHARASSFHLPPASGLLPPASSSPPQDHSLAPHLRAVDNSVDRRHIA